MSEVFRFVCSMCGKESSEGENKNHAEILARAEGFQFRVGGRVLCADCGSVKALKTTSAEYLKEHNVKKI